MVIRFDRLLDGNREQRPGETEFVAVGVSQVQEALSPFRITRLCRWLVPCSERTLVKCINIGDVEDYASPLAVCNSGNQSFFLGYNVMPFIKELHVRD